MSAKLISSDFKIIPISHEEQPIDNCSFTEWIWNITPKIQNHIGAIYLRISIRIPLDSKREEKKDLPIFEKVIDVL